MGKFDCVSATTYTDLLSLIIVPSDILNYL